LGFVGTAANPRAIRRLPASVAAAGISIARASTLTLGRHRSAATPQTSVPARWTSVIDDSTSLRDRPR
jgi:hypothetical protein